MILPLTFGWSALLVPGLPMKVERRVYIARLPAGEEWSSLYGVKPNGVG